MNPAPATSPSPPVEPPRPDDLEQLGERIAELSAQITAATYQLLTLIRKFDEREGWSSAYGGFRTCAHWLSWRTGLALGAAREKVRVARALGRLPAIAGAMRRAELSYSKVRALTRVATPGNETELLAFARAGTASQVERLVRAWCRADRLEEAEHEARRHASRYLSLWTDEDGMVAVRGRLDPEAGAALIKAVEAAADLLYEQGREAAATTGDPKPGNPEPRDSDSRDSDSRDSDSRDGAPRDSAPRDEVPAAQRRADALGRVAEAALAGGLDRGTRGDRYQVVLHVDAPVLAAAAPEAPARAEEPDPGAGVYQKIIPAGTSRTGAVRVDQNGVEPAAQRAEVYQKIIPAGTSKNGTGQIDHKEANKAGVAAEMYQKIIPAGTSCTNVDRRTAPPTSNRENASAGTPRDDPEPRGQSAFEAAGYVPAETSRRIACDSSLVTMTHDPSGGVLDVGRRTRTVPPALRRALTHRDHGCRFPGCGLAFCDAHHLHHWADGGETRLNNLVLLCRHHHRAVHEEGYEVRGGPGGELRFFRPDGRPIPEAPPLPALPDDALASLVGSLTEAGVEVEELGGFPEWEGGGLDLAWAVDALRSASGAEV